MDRLFHGCYLDNPDGTNKVIAPVENACLGPTDAFGKILMT